MNNLLGNQIKEFRESHDLSLREFGKLADISHTHIDSIEKGYDPRTGKKVKITNEIILKLSKAMNEEPARLFSLSIGEDDNASAQKEDHTPETIAAHFDGDGDLTEEEVNQINKFIEFVKQQKELDK